MLSSAGTSRLRVTTHGREPLFLILSIGSFVFSTGIFIHIPMSLSCAWLRGSPSAFARFGSRLFFHENFVVTQHTSAGVFHHRKNSQGADPRNEHRALLKGAFPGCIGWPEDRHSFSRYPPWLRITACAVWDRLSGFRGKIWDVGSLFVP